jgi:prepilin-type N-terminal cleavage/methylation domain-containing protein
MKFGSIGSPAVSQSLRPRRRDRRGGFTLIEALVALTILLAFAAALAPLMFQARRIIAGADERIAAEILLRALLTDPVDPASVPGLAREGESARLRWRMVAEPAEVEVVASQPRLAAPPPAAAPAEPQVKWSAYRLVASVEWAPGRVMSAETVRLGRSEQ